MIELCLWVAIWKHFLSRLLLVLFAINCPRLTFQGRSLNSGQAADFAKVADIFSHFTYRPLVTVNNSLSPSLKTDKIN
jgi:hypothetical protein